MLKYHLTGTYLDLEENPVSAEVKIVVQDVVVDTVASHMLRGLAPIQLVDGAFDVELPAGYVYIVHGPFGPVNVFLDEDKDVSEDVSQMLPGDWSFLARGPVGMSAYEVWLDAGNTGTEDDFIADLVGPVGPQGPATTDASLATYINNVASLSRVAMDAIYLPPTYLATSAVVGGGTATYTASDDTFLLATHGLVVGDVIRFNTTTATSGVTAGQAYYVKTAPTVDTFTLSATSGGATLDVTLNGTATGAIKITRQVAKAVGKGELVFRVTDHGAVPDGVTNSSPGINAASLAANNAGSSGFAYGRAVVEFPYGPNGYLCSTLLTIHAGITYRGDRKVKIQRGGAAAQYLFNASALTNVTIEGFTIESGGGRITGGQILCGTGTRVLNNTFTDETGLQYASAYPVNFQTGTAPISNVTISGNSFIGLRNSVHVRGNTYGVTVEDNTFTDWSSTAIAVDGDDESSVGAGDGTFSTDVIIRGNRVKDVKAVSREVVSKKIFTNVATVTLGSAPDAGWVVGATVYVDIGDTLFDGNHTISAVSGNDISWAKVAANTGPTVESGGYMAWGNRQPISVQHAADSENFYHRRVTVAGNQIIGNYVNHQALASGGTADCISIHHAKGVTVTGNTVEGGGDCGITLSARVWWATVTGNTLIGLSNAGVACGAQDVNDYVKTITIAGNTFVNCGQAGSMGSWAACGVNVRRTTGGTIASNTFVDDQAVKTMTYGVSVGDTTGTSTDVKLDGNTYVGVTQKRLTPAGNIRLKIVEDPETISKTADTPYVNSTLADDPHLTFAMEANGTYEITVVLGYTTNLIAGATPGIQVGIFGPASAVFYADTQGATGGTGSASVTINSNRNFLTSTASTVVSSGNTGATPARMVLTIRATCGSSNANFVIRAAQNNTDATNATTTKIGSYLTQKRVA